jgi:hypothetical protein
MHNLQCDIQGIPQHLYITKYTAERSKPFFLLEHATQQMTKLQIKHRFISTIFRDTNTTHLQQTKYLGKKKLLVQCGQLDIHLRHSTIMVSKSTDDRV